MELITIILSTLLGVVATGGVVVDTLAEAALRDQLAEAETLEVRIDNVPNYQLAGGRIDHTRIAARGVETRQLPGLRIDSIDLETDPVDVDLGRLRQGELVLDEPAQAALRLRLKDDDLNAFLQSALVQGWLDTLQFNLPGAAGDREQNRYGLANPSLEFLEGDRFRVLVDLQDRVTQENIPIVIDLGLTVLNGHRFALVDPTITVDGEDTPPQLLESFVQGAQERLTLRRLEALGVVARVINFKVRDNELDVAIFARIEPSSPLLTRQPAPEAVPPAP
ncbi:LmeA family phospholipid-binding protein [Nodosilinea sp. AN01ver1]|uniref:LmeA family phospholipid-binding protein n=1 Tax=Nodosilinea sp. AN01ver1 TaxID=3423362 RepID=UPI003D323EAD